MIAPGDLGPWVGNETWQRRVLLATALGMAVVHLVGILWTSGFRGATVKGDARSYFAYLPSLVLDGDLDLRNQFEVLQVEGATEYPFGIGRGNRARNPFPIAPALMWLPGYVVGLGIDAASGVAPRSGSQPRGFGTAAALGAALWSILLVGVGAELTRRLVGQCVGVPEAFASTLMAWMATAALYYTVISPLYSHAPAWVAVSLMLWLTWRAAHDPLRMGHWFWAGLAAGWMVAVRLQDGPLLAIPVALLTVLLVPLRSGRLALRITTVWLCAVIVGYLVQGFTSYWLHGAFVASGGAAALSRPTLSNLSGIFFSLGFRGWISWTPIVLPALVGLAVLARRGESAIVRTLAASAIAGLIGMVLIDLTHPFGAGAAFGGRRYVSATPLVALGLAAWLGRTVGSRSRALSWLVFSGLVAWNLWLLLSYELLVVRHGVYPTLLQTLRHAVGLGI